MCEQCVAECGNLGEPIPGWFLVRAHRDGNMMKAGQLGLVYLNDPSIILDAADVSPEPSDPEDTEWVKKAAATGITLTKDMTALESWKMVNAGIKAGFDPEEDGLFEIWLLDRMGRVAQGLPLPTIAEQIKRREMEEAEDEKERLTADLKTAEEQVTRGEVLEHEGVGRKFKARKI